MSHVPSIPSNSSVEVRCVGSIHKGPIEQRLKPDGRSVQQQCLACCRGVGRRMHRGLIDNDGAGLRRWKVKRLGEGQGNSRRREYEAFLRSPEWRAQRQRVLDRDNHTCRNCGDPATQVHHTRYAKDLRDTPDEDLIAACGFCNEAEAELRRGGLLR